MNIRWGWTVPLAATLVVMLPVTISADTPPVVPIVDDGLTVELAPFVAIPNTRGGEPPRLNAMASTGNRLFVVEERDGIVYEIVDRATDPRPVVFFDVGAAIATATGRRLDDSNPVHSGLRSVAFHPDFAENGLLYVSAMESRPATPAGHRYLSDVANPVAADSVLLEFTFDAPRRLVDPLSYREVFRVGMPVYDHTIRQITFDPAAGPADPDRGMLYIAHGDGSEISATVGGGQRNDALGKILRIDPRQDGPAPYRIPTSNPFVGDPTMLDEVFSLGHRNPHTLAFASAPDGSRLLISGEPGRDNIEELNLIEPGADYGWPMREGTFVHRTTGGGLIDGVAPLPPDESRFGFVFPAAQYGHQGLPGDTVTGESIAGGYAISNGSALSGSFFAADFPISGDLFQVSIEELATTTRRVANGASPSSLTQATLHRSPISFDHDADPTTPSLTRSSLLDVFDDAATYRGPRADVRFGQGPDGELYITSKRNNLVYLVTNSLPPSVPPPRSEPGTLAEAVTLDDILAATDYRADDADFLRLYRAFFDRDPDVAGARYWIGEARRGVSYDDIAWAFSTSPEFVLRYGPVSDEAFLETVYRNVLARPPDPDGFAYWLGLMNGGQITRHGVVRWVAAGNEFRARHPYAPT